MYIFYVFCAFSHIYLCIIYNNYSRIYLYFVVFELRVKSKKIYIKQQKNYYYIIILYNISSAYIHKFLLLLLLYNERTKQQYYFFIQLSCSAFYYFHIYLYFFLLNQSNFLSNQYWKRAEVHLVFLVSIVIRKWFKIYKKIQKYRIHWNIIQVKDSNKIWILYFKYDIILRNNINCI